MEINELIDLYVCVCIKSITDTSMHGKLSSKLVVLMIMVKI